MNWLPETDTSMVSECRRYRIAKVWVGGELFYEAHAGKEMLATRLPSADAARTVVNERDAVDNEARD